MSMARKKGRLTFDMAEERGLTGAQVSDVVNRIQEERSPRARAQDRRKDAPLTTNIQQWAEDPGHWDLPGVDTGPRFRESEGDDFDVESFIKRFF